MGYRVTQVDPTTAEEAMIRLWAGNLGPADGARERFRWAYLDPPHGEGRAFLLMHGPDATREACVGCAGAVPRLFSARGRILRASLLVDMAVEKRHRTLFPALSLQRGVRDRCREASDFVYGSPNRFAASIFSRLGYAELGRLTRVARILQHTAYVQRVLPAPALARPVGRILDRLLSSLEWLRARRARAAARLEWLEDVDARFDGLWQGARAQWGVVGHRGSDALRWRYLRKPNGRCRLAAVLDRRTDALAAYAILEPTEHAVEIVDLFGLSPAHLGLLLDLLIPALRAQGVPAVTMSLLAPERMRRLLASRGFRARQTRPVYTDIGQPLRARNDTLPEGEHWYLTEADCD
jgi:hypothetical protein